MSKVLVAMKQWRIEYVQDNERRFGVVEAYSMVSALRLWATDHPGTVVRDIEEDECK